MTYTKTQWVNGQAPAISAENLNKIENELESLDTGLSNKLGVDKVVNQYSTSETDVYSANYVNGIIESGSNANGKYIKYIDGTLICYSTKTGSTTENVDYFGHCRRTEWILITFPYNFYSTPIINSSCSLSGYVGEVEGNITTTGFEERILTASSNTGLSYSVSYIAIGRWK